MSWVCTIETGAVFASHETWCSAIYGEVDYTVVVAGGFNCVFVGGVIEGERDTICVEACVGFVEAVVVEWVGTPLVFAWTVVIIYLRIELTGRSDAPSRSVFGTDVVTACLHDIAVNDLSHTRYTVIGHEVECLSFDICVVLCLPY